MKKIAALTLAMTVLLTGTVFATAKPVVELHDHEVSDENSIRCDVCGNMAITEHKPIYVWDEELQDFVFVGYEMWYWCATCGVYI